MRVVWRPMKVHRWEEIEREQLSPDASRQVIHADRTTTARIWLAKGGVGSNATAMRTNK